MHAFERPPPYSCVRTIYVFMALKMLLDASSRRKYSTKYLTYDFLKRAIMPPSKSRHVVVPRKSRGQAMKELKMPAYKKFLQVPRGFPFTLF